MRYGYVELYSIAVLAVIHLCEWLRAAIMHRCGAIFIAILCHTAQLRVVCAQLLQAVVFAKAVLGRVDDVYGDF